MRRGCAYSGGACALLLALGCSGSGEGDSTGASATDATSVTDSATTTTTATATVTTTDGTSSGTSGASDSATTGSTSGASGPIFDVGNSGGTGGTGGGGLPPPFPTTCLEAEMGQTSVGCTFYPAALPGGGSPGFAVSNVSDQLATVTLNNSGGQVDSAMVAAGDIHIFTPGTGQQIASTTSIADKGYVIESDQPLQVYQFLPSNATVTADASIVLPEQALGTKHRMVAYNDLQPNNGRRQYAAIIATEDATEVTFTLAQPDSEVLGGGGIPTLDKANGPDSYTTMLDRLEVLVMAGSNTHSMTMSTTNELSGSLIESDKPVAVYSGNPVSYMPSDPVGFNCCADIVATAVPPTTVYGKQYAGVKLLPMGQQTDVWRFIGNADGTVINVSGGENQVINLDAGEFADIISTETFWASANLPFGLARFMPSSETVMLPAPGLSTYDCGDIATPGDPALMWMFPKGNWLNRYLFPVGPSASGQWCHDHATIVAPLSAWDMITLDGGALPMPTEIATSGVGFAYVQTPNAFYELEAPPDIGVEVTVYGYVDDGSYLYPGGMGLQALNPEG